jgi:hypothetical protein
MQHLAIDLHGITVDHLFATDNPILTAAIREAVSPTKAVPDGAGFDNKL